MKACWARFDFLLLICSGAGPFPQRQLGPECANAALHEDAVLSVELEDLPQPLLGRGHAFFGPLACRQRSHVDSGELMTG